MMKCPGEKLRDALRCVFVGQLAGVCMRMKRKGVARVLKISYIGLVFEKPSIKLVPRFRIRERRIARLNRKTHELFKEMQPIDKIRRGVIDWRT